MSDRYFFDRRFFSSLEHCSAGRSWELQKRRQSKEPRKEREAKRRIWTSFSNGWEKKKIGARPALFFRVYSAALPVLVAASLPPTAANSSALGSHAASDG